MVVVMAITVMVLGGFVAVVVDGLYSFGGGTGDKGGGHSDDESGGGWCLW